MPKVEAPKTEVPPVEPPKVEKPEVVVEEVKPAPAVVPEAETVKSASHEPVNQAPSVTEARSSGQTERPTSPVQVDTGAGLRPARIADRLKEFRAQQGGQAGPVKETKPHSVLNLRPRPVQLNAGRIEVSLSIQYGILAALGAVALLMIVFAIGKASGRAQPSESQGSVTMTEKNPVTDPTVAAPDNNMTAVPQGNNMIVIARHSDARQLEPLGKYFEANGIATLVVSFERLRKHLGDNNLNVDAVPKGDGYFLLAYSDPLYNNPDTPGTDGYKAKQKIIELGPKYKPAPGFDSFSAESFRSAYGLKMK